MNKYESSGLEAKYQLAYASNAMKHQRAIQSRKAYNPLYPKGTAKDSLSADESQREEQRLQYDLGSAKDQGPQENQNAQDEQNSVDEEQPGSGDKNS